MKKNLEFNFDKARGILFPAYTQLQVNSINALVKEANKRSLTKDQFAYVLATAYHECFNPKTPETRLTPMREFGGEKYLKSKAYYPYYGRGFVQLTWKTNYEKQGKRLGINLVNDLDAALDINTAADITIHGMLTGSFTGKKLSDYINDKETNFKQARRIINGMDKADLIAGYANQFMSVIDEKELIA